MALLSTITCEHELAIPNNEEQRTGVKRKPVAALSPALAPEKAAGLDVQQEFTRRDAPNILPRPYNAPRHNTGFVTRLRTRWLLLRKRTRILILAAIVILVALILGISIRLITRSRISNLPLPSGHGGPYSGDLTYYDPALGACGFTSDGSNSIVAVSHIIFDAVSTSTNPNANPLCGKKIRARRDGKSIDLTVVDRCTGCQPTDIDTTRSVFADLASIDEGRVPVQWNWLEDVPSAAASE